MPVDNLILTAEGSGCIATGMRPIPYPNSPDYAKRDYQDYRDKILNSSPVTHLSFDEYQALRIAEAIEKLLPVTFR